jgi:3-deoxy-7-phosphoheptulonate synthase
MATTTLERLSRAEQIVAGLPDEPYEILFQPEYADKEFLIESIAELLTIEPVTTQEQVDEVRRAIADAHQAPGGRPIIFTGECEEGMDLKTKVPVLVGRAVSKRELVLSVFPDALYVGRDRGQLFKPRSNRLQTLANGLTVVSYQGDGTNGYDVSEREPDPSRLVAAAVQSNSIEKGMKRLLGFHVPAAHEALNLAYEESFMTYHDGKKYSTSGDILWDGYRTNDPYGPHVELLSGIENTVAVKIGANSDEEHIKALATKLNPEGIPGKLLFMLRLGNDVVAMDRVLEAIAEHAPESDELYDIHGSTRQLSDGTKIRAVSAVIEDIELLASACLRHGKRLRGLHLETHTDNRRHECVDSENERPRDSSRVDPGFNPRQTLKILNGVSHILR